MSELKRSPDMQTASQLKYNAVRYWEKRRIAYNFILVAPALFGWGAGGAVPAAVGDQYAIGTFGVCILFVLAALAANICYSFVYALEFLLLSEEESSLWLRHGRRMIFMLGCLLAIVLAVVGGRNIAIVQYSGLW